MESDQSTAERLFERLHLLEQSSDASNNQEYQAFELISECIQELRTKVINQGFASLEEQITFFRYIKPKVMGRLIYHKFRIDLKAKLRTCPICSVSKFKKKTIKRLQKSEKQNQDFIHYLNSGKTFLDSVYFVQVATLENFNSTKLEAHLDPEFSSLYDHVIADRIAREHIENYLNADSKEEPSTTSNLKWTASKASLVELIYGLHYSQSIDKGNASLKELCSTLEKAFNIQVGDLYGTFQDIQMRKGERSKYLNSLVITFDNKLQESEDFKF